MTSESPFSGDPMISFGLEEEQAMIQETVRKFAVENLRPKLREFEHARALPESLRRQFHELGLALVDVPEALGGQGASLTTAAIVQEELAFGDPGAAIALWSPHLFVQAVLALGDEAQQKRFLARFAETAGALRSGAVAYSERGAPLDGFNTTAKRSGGDWILDGKKAFVVNGGVADLTVVFAQLEGTSGWDGAAAFVVEAGNPGLQAGERHALLGLDTVHAAEIVLESCRVPDANRLLGGSNSPKESNFLLGSQRMFARGGLLNAARQVGLARAAYEFALDYTQERKAFGKVIAHFQSIAFTLAEMHMDVEAARWMVWRAAVELEKGKVETVYEAIAHANEAAWRVADNGVQLLGGAD